MIRYSDASVVITGASGGIGRHIALAFAEKTNRPLILISRSKKGLDKTAHMAKQAGGEQVVSIPCDASDLHQVNSIQLTENFAAPGIIINNAGDFLLKPLQQTTSKEFHDQFESNFFTAVNITNRFLPALKKMDRGLIVNICSVSALYGLAHSGAYSSAKHALLGYSRSLRVELMETNIGITAINLGQTESPSWKESEIDKDLLIDPDDVASIILTLTQLSKRTLVEELIIQPQHGQVPPM
ncbi:MAG: SDR family NAD(P)-dependent oxidoreductase [Balneolaceae bacterium]